MSAQYRDNLNKSRSLYSNATTRQNCVSCPSSCLRNREERSSMDRLMFRAWSKGPSGDPSVFHQSSNACPTCGSNHRHRHHHKENYEACVGYPKNANVFASGFVPSHPGWMSPALPYSKAALIEAAKNCTACMDGQIMCSDEETHRIIAPTSKCASIGQGPTGADYALTCQH
jgi:hypothetical protein